MEQAAGGRLIGVGVGPGDPSLLTLRAIAVLRSADRVVVPTTAEDAVGRAESILREAVPDVAPVRLVFDMAADRLASHRAAAAHLVPWLAGGETVAFATLGDPNVYSTFSALTAALAGQLDGLEVETVPGVTAFQELAARAGVVLLDGSERLHLVTALDGTADFEEALGDPDGAVVLYKGGRHLGAIAEALERSGRTDGAVFGELLGLPGERIAHGGDLAADLGAGALRPASYLATVIVPPKGRPE